MCGVGNQLRPLANSQYHSPHARGLTSSPNSTARKLTPTSLLFSLTKQAVGFHYASSWVDKAEMAVGLETDPSHVMNEIFTTARKGGRVSVVGVYLGKMNHLNFGCYMGKWGGVVINGGGPLPLSLYSLGCTLNKSEGKGWRQSDGRCRVS